MTQNLKGFAFVKGPLTAALQHGGLGISMEPEKAVSLVDSLFEKVLLCCGALEQPAC